MPYHSSGSKKPRSYGGGGGSKQCYRVPETPPPPQRFDPAAPSVQMPPSESQLISQRKQMAGTK